MLHWGPLSAWVEVDGAKLETYSEDTAENGKKVTCWIPSTVDKDFTVCWSSSDRTVATKAVVRIDGNVCGRSAISTRAQNRVMKTSSIQVGDSERLFVFGNLQITDDDSFLANSSGSESMGEISLEMWHVIVMKSGVGPPIVSFNVPNEPKFHERSKKAGTHCVKFDAVQPGHLTKKMNAVHTRDIHQHPEVTFVFRYRPLELLQANGIAPLVKPPPQKRRAESPIEQDSKPVMVDAPADDSDDKQIKVLEDQLNHLRAKKADRHRSKRAKTVKREPEPIPSGIFKVGEIIDLT